MSKAIVGFQLEKSNVIIIRNIQLFIVIIRFLLSWSLNLQILKRHIRLEIKKKIERSRLEKFNIKYNAGSLTVKPVLKTARIK